MVFQHLTPIHSYLLKFKHQIFFMDLEDIERLLKIIVLLIVIIIISMVLVKLNKMFGFFGDIKKSIYCWAFGC